MALRAMGPQRSQTWGLQTQFFLPKLNETKVPKILKISWEPQNVRLQAQLHHSRHGESSTNHKRTLWNIQLCWEQISLFDAVNLLAIKFVIASISSKRYGDKSDSVLDFHSNNVPIQSDFRDHDGKISQLCDHQKICDHLAEMTYYIKE